MTPPRHPPSGGKRHRRPAFKIGDWVRYPQTSKTSSQHFCFAQVKDIKKNGRILVVKPRRHFRLEEVEAWSCTLWKKAMHNSRTNDTTEAA